MREGSLAGLLAAFTLIAAGCQKPLPAELCSTSRTLPLAVSVRDSVSGALLPNAVLYASMGTRTDTVAIGSNVEAYPVSLAWAAGTYGVVAQAPGYIAWTSTQTVTSDGCHLASTAVTALMQKAP